jgi:hypothetical protein
VAIRWTEHEIKMTTLRTLKQLGLIGLVTCFLTTYGQTNNSNNNIKNELIGVWGMYKDKHPDGWGSWDPPHQFLEFMPDNKYNKIFIQKKENIIFFGTYEVIKDSIIVFHESTGTDGIHIGPVQADTVRLYSLKAGVLEIWADWDRVLWKSVKKFGHKKKYRPLTIAEKEKIELIKTKLMDDYTLINDNDGKTDN